jgi:predicted metal-dependent hydrolase
MPEKLKEQTIQEIEFKVIYSSRRTLGISILPDSTVVVRVPYRTSDKTINRIVQEKASWIIKHRDGITRQNNNKLNRRYVNGENHLFRGYEFKLSIEKSNKSYFRVNCGVIEIGLINPDDPNAVKNLLYKGYKIEANNVFPVILEEAIIKHSDHMFKPAGLVVRTMKRRWGSCSNKGIITLSTELIKLPDLFIEYVAVHELCHLRHHNHSAKYYELLSELFPNWKEVRKELRRYGT